MDNTASRVNLEIVAPESQDAAKAEAAERRRKAKEASTLKLRKARDSLRKGVIAASEERVAAIEDLSSQADAPLAAMRSTIEACEGVLADATFLEGTATVLPNGEADELPAEMALRSRKLILQAAAKLPTRAPESDPTRPSPGVRGALAAIIQRSTARLWALAKLRGEGPTALPPSAGGSAPERDERKEEGSSSARKHREAKKALATKIQQAQVLLREAEERADEAGEESDFPCTCSCDECACMCAEGCPYCREE